MGHDSGFLKVKQGSNFFDLIAFTLLVVPRMIQSFCWSNLVSLFVQRTPAKSGWVSPLFVKRHGWKSDGASEFSMYLTAVKGLGANPEDLWICLWSRDIKHINKPKENTWEMLVFLKKQNTQFVGGFGLRSNFSGFSPLKLSSSSSKELVISVKSPMGVLDTQKKGHWRGMCPDF